MLDTVTQKFSALFRKGTDASKVNPAPQPSPHSISTRVDVVPAQIPNGSSQSDMEHVGRARRRPRRKQRPNESIETVSSGTNFFGNLPISSSLAKALAQIGYVSPTPIQQAVIPSVNEGLDVVGQAQTGTGKTAAFGIPLIESLDPRIRTVQGLVLVPTRELAVQVKIELERLAMFKGLKSVAVYGGQAIARQLEAFRRGSHIIIATPGRLIDHIGRRTLDLGQLRFLVLDEADQMLDIGFADDINRILRHVPSSRQTLLFSATMPTSIRRLVHRYMKDPKWILVGGDSEPVEQVTQVYYEIAERDRYAGLEELLNEPDGITQALIFRRTKTGVDRLVNYLKRRGHDVQAIHGDITQAQRDSVMSMFRARKLRILVATNVAARGLDIPAVSHVINYDIPGTVEEYIHRIGRTARMGRPGTAITFVSEWDFNMLDAIQAHVGDELRIQRLALYAR
jgi:ATP-dependent RNA helicase DeaD